MAESDAFLAAFANAVDSLCLSVHIVIRDTGNPADLGKAASGAACFDDSLLLWRVLPLSFRRNPPQT